MTPRTENLVRLNCGAPVALRAKTDTAGDGNTLFGHFAVFDTWTEIHSYWEGDFLERIAPGAFKDTLGGGVRVLYDHGHDPQIGNKPLGVPDVLREDKTGAYYEVSLFDAPYVNDLKPALRAGQMGASFRFSVTAEEWVDPKDSSAHNPMKLPERTITAVNLFEFGPVTFPAYAEASAGLRSRTDEFHERLLNDPDFVARFISRVGPRHAAEALTNAAGSAPAGTTDAGTAPVVDRSGRHVAAARTSLATLRKGHP